MSSLPEWYEPGAYPVASNVYRIPLPLPGDALKAVNIYVVLADDGLVLVDAGWATRQMQVELTDGLKRLGHTVRDVTQILVTHVHRDHYTQAMLVRRAANANVHLGRLEAPSLDIYLRNDGTAMQERLARVTAGGAPEVAERVRGQATRAGQAWAWEKPDAWLDDLDEVRAGDRTLVALHTPGHTRGHLCFWDPETSLLFAGDHILPHITPSIGFEPHVDPLALARYLESLDRVLTVPDGPYLPAHGPVGGDFHTRVGDLQAHHARRLELCREAADGGARTALQVAEAIPWTRRNHHFSTLDSYNQLIAVSETAAHLDVLVENGSLTADTADGVRWYKARSK